jgi:hypothetical protein
MIFMELRAACFLYGSSEDRCYFPVCSLKDFCLLSTPYCRLNKWLTANGMNEAWRSSVNNRKTNYATFSLHFLASFTKRASKPLCLASQ